MKNKILLISTLLAGLFILNSCLKDDEHDYWKDGVAGKKYATIFSPGFHSKSIQPIADAVTFEIMINIATDKLPTTDVVVNLAFDDAAIVAYDSTLLAKAKANKDTNKDGTWKWKDYKPFPSAVLNTPVVTIPAGSRTGTATFTIDRADTVKLTGNYMLCVTISGVTPASVILTSNMKTYMLALPLANKYEGIYAGDGYFKHPTPASSRFLTADKELLTVNSNTVHTGLADLADPATGDYFIDIIVDENPANEITVGGRQVNPVTIVSTGAGPAVNVQLDTADDLITFDTGVRFNYYDPSTKTFVLRYHYNNGAAWREVQEILTKK